MVLTMVHFWWGFWEFTVVESWFFPGLLAVVTESLVLVLAALALLPEPSQGGHIDLLIPFDFESPGNAQSQG
jgi:hypothetical protein